MRFHEVYYKFGMFFWKRSKDSQNLLNKIAKIFVTLSLKIKIVIPKTV